MVSLEEAFVSLGIDAEKHFGEEKNEDIEQDSCEDLQFPSSFFRGKI